LPKGSKPIGAAGKVKDNDSVKGRFERHTLHIHVPNQITYGGIPVNLDTPALTEFLGKYLPLEDTVITLGERVYPGPRLLSLTRPLHNVDRPRLKIGQFWYPVGMSRWSECHLILTDDNYSQILGLAFDNQGDPLPNALTLDQNGVQVTTQLFVLEIRPISRIGTQPACYLMTLVDERYFFQFSFASFVISDSTKWTDLIKDVASALNITYTHDSIPAAYLKPEPESDLKSHYENAALLADGLAGNVGMRWVRNLDGTYKLMSVATAQEIVAANMPSVWEAGGDALQDSVLLNAQLPQRVHVSFLKFANGAYVNPDTDHLPYPKNTGDEYGVSILLDTVPGFEDFEGFTGSKSFHDTAKAIYSDLDSPPTNASTLRALAVQIATDYYGWANDDLDQSFPLLAWPTMEGNHDVSWQWDQNVILTRVQSFPINYGVEELLHSAGEDPITTGCCPIVAVITGGNPSDGWDWCAAELNGSCGYTETHNCGHSACNLYGGLVAIGQLVQLFPYYSGGLPGYYFAFCCPIEEPSSSSSTSESSESSSSSSESESSSSTSESGSHPSTCPPCSNPCEPGGTACDCCCCPGGSTGAWQFNIRTTGVDCMDGGYLLCYQGGCGWSGCGTGGATAALGYDHDLGQWILTITYGDATLTYALDSDCDCGSSSSSSSSSESNSSESSSSSVEAHWYCLEPPSSSSSSSSSSAAPPSPVTFECCGTEVTVASGQLKATCTASGGCGCINGASCIMTWDGSTWNGVINACGASFGLQMILTGGTSFCFELNILCNGSSIGGSSSLVSPVSCNPLDIVFTEQGMEECGSCGALSLYTITVTEV
jgi:hypothetical protein